MESPSKPELYAIPVEYRQMENMHIIFWLIKDVSWCMIWKPLGLLMIAPTLTFALIICWRTRHLKSELAHNLAIIFWIVANSYWMISEFLGFDAVMLGHVVEGKHLALLPFTIGIVILAYYYVVQKPQEKRAEQVATL